MHICVIGAGYVGLVVAACLADFGHHVHCVETDVHKLSRLRDGVSPIYEQGLEALLARARSRLVFSSDVEAALSKASACFVCVGTPEADDGGADLTALRTALTTIGRALCGPQVIVLKSTVPVGTHRLAQRILAQQTRTTIDLDVVSNPEFLREGSAVVDFCMPDRIVLGLSSVRAEAIMREIYAPVVAASGAPILVMDHTSAELAKYAANAMLATRISFINEIATLCEALGADVSRVREGIARDRRIGSHFLDAGLGYGGCCFPKDVHALMRTARAAAQPLELVSAADRVNQRQRQSFVNKVRSHFYGDLRGLHFALWGVAFKPGTDDVRDAPAFTIAESLLELGARITVFDPQAQTRARAHFGDRIEFAPDAYSTLAGRDALLVATEWPEFVMADLPRVRDLLKTPLIFDGRNLWDPVRLSTLGFQYYSVGRPVLPPPENTRGSSANLSFEGLS